MATVYLIPSLLTEDGIGAIHPATLTAIKDCQVFFAENQRTTRRFFKQLWKFYAPGENINIDDFEWYDMNDSPESLSAFKKKLNENKSIGIVSEAGCPGVADPGQQLVAIAQESSITIKSLVGPSSILLALMASGMNGQQFKFNGYLPIDTNERAKAIKELESESRKKNCTQIFIETPYRNNQLLESLLKNCQSETRLCIASNITSEKESIKTKTIAAWKKQTPDLHKQPTLFFLLA